MARPKLLGKAAADTIAGFMNTVPRDHQYRSDVTIRNFDARPHDVDLTLSAIDNNGGLDRTYTLPPETTACVVNELDPGAYDIAVTLDGRRHAIGTGRIDEQSGETIIVETGNGVISIAQRRP